jgi:hypothetical protein
MPKRKTPRYWDAYCWVNGRSQRYRVSGIDAEEARLALKEILKQEKLALDADTNTVLIPVPKPPDLKPKP